MYTFEGKKYCLNDYQLLYAPICNQCHLFVEGKMIKVELKQFLSYFLTNELKFGLIWNIIDWKFLRKYLFAKVNRFHYGLTQKFLGIK